MISVAIAQRALALEGKPRRRMLVLAGGVTGITIWATHFSAMLAYAPGVEIRFDAVTAIASVALAVLIASCGWLMLNVPGRHRGALAGATLGIALCAAHFLDMSALRIGGLVAYDFDLIFAAIVLGIPICMLTGLWVRRGAGPGTPLRAGLALTFGILALHFVAMSALRIYPGPAELVSRPDFGVDGLADIVIAASALILAAGLGLAVLDQRIARATAEDRERLRQSEEHYRYSVELNPQIPWIGDAEGRVMEISPRWAEVVGQPVEEAHGHGWCQAVHPEDLPNVVKLWRRAVATGDGSIADTRYRLRRADGSYGWFRARARPRRDEQGEIIQWYGSLEDINEQVVAEAALRASEERYRLASRATNDVIWDWSVDRDLIEWSGAVDSVLGYPEAREGTTYQWWLERVHPADRGRVQAFAPPGSEPDQDQWTDEFRFLSGSGEYLDMLSRGYVVRDDGGRPIRIVGALQDITARNRSEEELRWAAHHDPLTQLPNRKLFAARLERALDDARGPDRGVGLVVLDVDGFKTLNDTLGHLAGDALLREVAVRLTRQAPPSATVARLGGDEFAVVLPDLKPEQVRRETVEDVLSDMDAPFEFDGRPIEFRLSAGAAVFPRDAKDAEDLLKSADLALYSAKGEGPGLIRGFQPAMREAVEAEKKMLSEAREALTGERIVPFYQPKVCLRTGRILGFEALLRWHHPQRGLQPPATLVAAFSDSRLAVELTDRMLDRVIADIALWREQGCRVQRIAVNGSTEDFRRGDFADRILGRLERAGVPPACLELEVTETVFLGKQIETVERTLRTLREAGVTIALDDFGTGYASLTHLKQFPVDTIKIDRSFVSRLTSPTQDDAVIVGALIDLGRNLGITTVAEGVETQAEADFLRARGCHAGQGFLFARAVAAATLPGLIGSWAQRPLWLPERAAG